jgi:hypothetical protein
MTFTSFRHGGFTKAADPDLTDAETIRARGGTGPLRCCRHEACSGGRGIGPSWGRWLSCGESLRSPLDEHTNPKGNREHSDRVRPPTLSARISLASPPARSSARPVTKRCRSPSFWHSVLLQCHARNRGQHCLRLEQEATGRGRGTIFNHSTPLSDLGVSESRSFV